MKAEYLSKIIAELIELIDEGVYIVDQDGVGRFYNKAMASMEKVNIEDVLGKKFHEAFPDFSLNDSTMFEALKKNNATLRKQQTYKNLYGKEITTINSTIPIIADGQTVAAVEVAKDITNIRKMSDTLLELTESKHEPAAEAGVHLPGSIKRYTFDDIYGENPAFRELISRAKKAARNDASVFIYGETGTGKELLAQSIHHAGSRKDRPFLAQNCAAIPETLLEGILFGTAKGGFTGAVDRAGLFEQASGGTLLLDEISAMPYDLQSKLLRVLQENSFYRVGGTTPKNVNVRVICANNIPLQKLVNEGKFREDLYYRLNICCINVPPLRERPEDIECLAAAFIDHYSLKYGIQKTFTPEAYQKLEEYHWPGNVRELENTVHRLYISERERQIGEDAVDELLNVNVYNESMIDLKREVRREESLDFNKIMDEQEKKLIAYALKKEGTTRKAAEFLNIPQTTLARKKIKHQL